MMIGAGFMENAFVEGLAKLKEEMEANEPSTGGMSAISVESHEAFEAMVAAASGTMQELSQLLPELYMKVFTAIGTQGLEVAGPAFIHYLDFDEATNSSNFLAGFSVTTAGTNAGEVMAKSYPALETVQGLHMGPYEKFQESYGKLQAYVASHNLEVSGEAIEFYQVGMQETQDPAQFETLIVFPLK
jgi:effector-binding domain-containing protein